MVKTVERTIRDCLADGTDRHRLRQAIDESEAEGRFRHAEAEELSELVGSRANGGPHDVRGPCMPGATLKP